jgi:hypothetical protein
MVVRGASGARDRLSSRDTAREVMTKAVERCLELGLAPDEIASLAYQQSLHAKHSEVQLAFVECNVERAEALATELSEALEVPVTPLVLGDFEPEEVVGRDLVVTTFFHLAEVRRIVRAATSSESPEVLGIVVGPHLKTLVRLSQIPGGHRIGIYYTTEDQAEAIRQSLADTGVESVDVITGPDDPAILGCDLVIVPSESPDLADEIRGKTELFEWGNVLDASSVRMVGEVMDEVRERKGSLAKLPAVQLAAVR